MVDCAESESRCFHVSFRRSQNAVQRACNFRCHNQPVSDKARITMNEPRPNRPAQTAPITRPATSEKIDGSQAKTSSTQQLLDEIRLLRQINEELLVHEQVRTKNSKYRFFVMLAVTAFMLLIQMIAIASKNERMSVGYLLAVIIVALFLMLPSDWRKRHLGLD